jgi:hypothetical protein
MRCEPWPHRVCPREDAPLIICVIIVLYDIYSQSFESSLELYKIVTKNLGFLDFIPFLTEIARGSHSPVRGEMANVPLYGIFYYLITKPCKINANYSELTVIKSIIKIQLQFLLYFNSSFGGSTLYSFCMSNNGFISV